MGRVNRTELCIGKTKWRADALGDETIQFHAAGQFDDAAEHVRRHPVLPGCTGLIGEGEPAELRRHFGVALLFIYDVCALVSLFDEWTGQMTVGETGCVPQQ